MEPIFSVRKKKCLITGASSGIGREIAILLASLGAEVVITGRNEERLRETFEILDGANHHMVTADLNDTSALQQIISSGIKYDVVIFNAGAIEYLPIKFISTEKIKKIFDVNFTATALLCQLLLKNRLINQGGSVVFISSISASLGVIGTALYASSKSAVKTFAKVLAREVAPQKIRSNVISPGIVKTAMTESAIGVTGEKAVDEAAKNYPLGYGTAKDVAGTVVFLASDASRWITGTEIIMDGGYTLE